jgi:hypothetical protein
MEQVRSGRALGDQGKFVPLPRVAPPGDQGSPPLVTTGGGRRQGSAAPVKGVAGNFPRPSSPHAAVGWKTAMWGWHPPLGVERSRPSCPLSGATSPMLGSDGRWLGVFRRPGWGHGSRAAALGAGWGDVDLAAGGGWRCCSPRSLAMREVKGRRVWAWCEGRPDGPLAPDLKTVAASPYGARRTSPAPDSLMWLVGVVGCGLWTGGNP